MATQTKKILLNLVQHHVPSVSFSGSPWTLLWAKDPSLLTNADILRILTNNNNNKPVTGDSVGNQWSLKFSKSRSRWKMDSLRGCRLCGLRWGWEDPVSGTLVLALAGCHKLVRDWIGVDKPTLSSQRNALKQHQARLSWSLTLISWRCLTCTSFRCGE